MNQARSIRDSLCSLGNALRCNGTRYDLVNRSMGSGRISGALDCWLAAELVVLLKR